MNIMSGTNVLLYYFNAAEAHSSGLIGEKHDLEKCLFLIILQVVSGWREAIYIFEDD